MNQLDPFESLIKDATEQYELPYDPSAWSELQSKISTPQKSTQSFGKGGLIAACFSGILSIAAILYLGQTIEVKPSTSQQSNVSQEILTTQRTSEQKKSLNEHHTIINTDKPVQTPDKKTEQTYVLSLNDEEVHVKIETKKENGLVIEEVIMKNKAGEILDRSVINRDPFKQSTTSTESLKDIAFTPAIPEIQTAACVGEIVEFSSWDSSNTLNLSWSFGDGATQGGANASHTYTEPGMYKVMLSSQSKTTQETKEVSGYIHIKTSPQFDFTYETSDNASRPITSFEPHLEEGVQIQTWDLGNGKASKSKRPSTIYNTKGLKTVSLTTSYEGCIATVEKQIHIKNDYKLLAPNSFTPNGDGDNDTWFPLALRQLDYDFRLTVYNQKTGRLVYTTNGQQSWEGIHAGSGENCSEGYYVWYVVLTNENKRQEQYKGSVYLYR